MANYLSMQELQDLMAQVLESYGDELVYARIFGTTVKKRDMWAYTVMLGASKSTYSDELRRRNSVLIDGVHHAREVTTISQTVFSFLWLLYSYERGDESTLKLLQSSAVVFIPVVNVDGVTQINQWYESTGKLYKVRKNRRYIASKMSKCNGEDLGVDLNRNYSFKFGYNQSGSSSDPCA